MLFFDTVFGVGAVRRKAMFQHFLASFTALIEIRQANVLCSRRENLLLENSLMRLEKLERF